MQILIISTIIILTTLGCSSKKIRTEVKEEISKIPPAITEDTVGNYEHDLLKTDEQLTKSQKDDLSELITKMNNKNKMLDDEIIKTKAILFKTLVDKNNGRAKLNFLENQIISLNRKKNRNTLNAYKDARNIVGKSNTPLEKTLQMIDNRNKYEF